MRKRQSLRLSQLLLLWLILAPALWGQTNPELIVLLPADSNPTAVVAAIGSEGNIPYGLGAGNPIAARLVLPDRPQGRLATWVAQNPDRPLSRFYRYIVLTYPENTDTESLRSTLSAGAVFESVERNEGARLHSALTTNDPFLGSFSAPDTNFSQWGLHLLELPAAWDWVKGHAQIGVVDTGVQRTHEELQAFSGTAPSAVYRGGNVREHLSYDLRNERCDIDEKDTANDPYAGHGTHVSGIIAAKTNNEVGVAGTCWNCSIQMQKVFPEKLGDQLPSLMDRVSEGLEELTEQGASIVNGSFGIDATALANCAAAPAGIFCSTLALAEERDILFVASAGNDLTAVDFPARDSRVLAVGGIQRVPLPPPQIGYGWTLWDDRVTPGCPSIFYPNLYSGNTECGSNTGSELDLVAPARAVLSSLYKGLSHNVELECGDASNVLLGNPDDGFGVCRGTSMAAPFVTGIAGLVRSVNPLLSRVETADVLKSTASQAAGPTTIYGAGIPDAEAAVRRALGSVSGRVLRNRVTPLFTLRGLITENYIATNSPQEASALTFHSEDPFDTVGPLVPWYDLAGGCQISPCPQNRPGASFYVFTTDQPPYPGAPPLTPLYKLRRDPALYSRCGGPSVPTAASFNYTTNAEGIQHFKNRLDEGFNIGFDLDGMLGYIYQWCEPHSACQPPGTVKIHRLYHPQRRDWVLIPENEVAAFSAAGYIVPTFPNTYREVLGYAYPNVDSDGDYVIDGFETMLGTNPAVVDSDCDGADDGEEILFYDRASPNPAAHGYGDALRGPCGFLFYDGFESGDVALWNGDAASGEVGF